MGPALIVKDVVRDLHSRDVAARAAERDRKAAEAAAAATTEARHGAAGGRASDDARGEAPSGGEHTPTEYVSASSGLPVLAVELDMDEPTETSEATARAVRGGATLAGQQTQRHGARAGGWTAPQGGMGLGAPASSTQRPASMAGSTGDGTHALAPFGLEPDGGRKRSMWAALAYNFSDRGRATAAAKAGAYERHLAAAAAAAAAHKEALLREKLNTLERALALDSDDPLALESSLNADWGHIRIQSLCSGEDAVTAIKRLILLHYTALSDVFKSFSGSSSKAGLSSMQVDEFLHCAASLGAFRLSSQRSALVGIFNRANAGRGTDADALGSDSMSRFEFVESVLLMAQLRFEGRRHPNGKRITPPEFVERFLEDYVQPLARRLSSGEVRGVLRQWPIQRFLLEHEGRLRKVFDFYASLDEERDRLAANAGRRGRDPSRAAAAAQLSGAAGMASKSSAGELGRDGQRSDIAATAAHKSLMNVDEFAIMLEHCGLLQRMGGGGGAGRSKAATGRREPAMGVGGVAAANASLRLNMPTVTLPLVRRVFGAVQRDDDGAAAAGLVATAGDSTEQMVYGEFIEGVARIGVERWAKEAPGSHVSDRIRWAIVVVAWLADHLGHARLAPLVTEDLQALAGEIERRLEALTMPSLGLLGGHREKVFTGEISAAAAAQAAGGGLAGARALRAAPGHSHDGESQAPFVTAVAPGPRQ